MTVDPGRLLVDLAFGFVLSSAVATAAKLDVADIVTEGPKTSAEIASAVSGDAQSMQRLLRTLASVGVFREDSSGRFHLTPAAKLLSRSNSASLRDAVLMITQDIFWKPQGQLDETVLTGKNGLERMYGKPFFDYLLQDKEAGVVFHRGMASLSALENAPIAACYDFTSLATIVDVGGGQGGFLIEVLKRAPNALGINFDHASVLAHAFQEFSSRWKCAAGDFFVSVPQGADAYILKRILHDWTDEDCVTILTNIQQAMAPTGRVLVVDAVIPPGNDPHGAKVLDVLMMGSLEGRERTENELVELFNRAGLRFVQIVSTPTLLSITEARKA